MSLLDDKINEYTERFNENVPLFEMPSMSEPELIEVIDESLRSGKPIEIEDEEEGAVY